MSQTVFGSQTRNKLREPYDITHLRETHLKDLINKSEHLKTTARLMSNQRSEGYFSWVKRMIRPIKIPKDACFSHNIEINESLLKSHCGAWVMGQVPCLCKGSQCLAPGEWGRAYPGGDLTFYPIFMPNSLSRGQILVSNTPSLVVNVWFLWC